MSMGPLPTLCTISMLRNAVHRLFEGTTLETMANAEAARAWALSALGGDETNASEVTKFGITADMFPFRDWVGRRYSMGSAIGLSTMIAIGPVNFRDMLAGFHAVDEDFRTAPFARNLPVLLGLLAVCLRAERPICRS
jgi:glucose-6-phosphate isomerase